jgi:uncharacterized membrane protein
MEYLIVKWLHILSSTVVFGTGIGSAFYMLIVSLQRNAKTTADVVRLVVIADYLFTAPTMVIQPVSGFYLVHLAGMPLDSPWIAWSIVLYLVAGASWLPVVWIQIRMRDLSAAAASSNAALPLSYFRYLRWWIALGFVAFFALVTVFYLMVMKPT